MSLTQRPSGPSGSGGDSTYNSTSASTLPKAEQSTSPSTHRRLSCPFFKRYRQAGVAGPSCTGNGWPTTHRVKEHLYRRHGPPISCSRCQLEFKTRDDLHDHLNKDTICGKKPKLVIDQPRAITEKQREELKRKRKAEVDEEEEWNRVYKILFPDETIVPSPYADENDPESRQGREFQQHVRVEFAAVLRDLFLHKVPREAKYAGIRSQVEKLIETIFDTDLVDEALSNVTQSFKTRQNSMDSHNPNSNNLGPSTPTNFASSAPHLEQKEGEPAVRFNMPPIMAAEQNPQPSEYGFDDLVAPSGLPQPESWGFGSSADLTAPIGGPFEDILPSELDNGVTQPCTEQIDRDWFRFAEPTGHILPSNDHRQKLALYGDPTRQCESIGRSNPLSISQSALTASNKTSGLRSLEEEANDDDDDDGNDDDDDEGFSSSPFINIC